MQTSGNYALAGRPAVRHVEDRTMETWKAFEQNPITHSVAHYLMAISDLIEEYGYARVSDVAKKLDITRGSASITLKGLKERGLVLEDDHRHIRLSDAGKNLAISVKVRRYVLLRFLTGVLGVSAVQAEIDTCKMEHLVSAETTDRITQYLRFLESRASLARTFHEAFVSYEEECSIAPRNCVSCAHDCLEQSLLDA